MPNYYSPYNFYPATYMVGNSMSQQQPISYGGVAQPSDTQALTKSMEWVEGEVGAKAYQMPPGWPPNKPIPLWDSTDTVIYVKSWSPMGIPNPMQKLHYTMPDQQNHDFLPAGQSGSSEPIHIETNENYASKDDIQQIRNGLNRLEEMIQRMNTPVSSGNQNGRNYRENKGGS